MPGNNHVGDRAADALAGAAVNVTQAAQARARA